MNDERQCMQLDLVDLVCWCPSAKHTPVVTVHAACAQKSVGSIWKMSYVVEPHWALQKWKKRIRCFVCRAHSFSPTHFTNETGIFILFLFVECHTATMVPKKRCRFVASAKTFLRLSDGNTEHWCSLNAFIDLAYSGDIKNWAIHGMWKVIDMLHGKRRRCT